MATLELSSLDCIRKQDVTGSDEPRIKVDGDVKWSGVMTKDDTDPVGKNIPFSGSVAVELEEMNGSKPKKIGPTAFVRDDGTTASPLVFKTSGAHYELHFNVS